MRRRMLMTKPKQPEYEWDYEWDYRDGVLLEDSGLMVKTTSGSSSSEMTDDGQRLTVHRSPAHVKLTSAKQPTCNSGVLYAKFVLIRLASANGFRLMLSNGTNGIQVYINSTNGLYVDNTGTAICALDLLVEYELMIVLNKSGENEVYLNGERVCSTTSFETQYCNNNNVIQQEGGETLLRELKYKFNINGEG